MVFWQYNILSGYIYKFLPSLKVLTLCTTFDTKYFHSVFLRSQIYTLHRQWWLRRLVPFMSISSYLHFTFVTALALSLLSISWSHNMFPRINLLSSITEETQNYHKVRYLFLPMKLGNLGYLLLNSTSRYFQIVEMVNPSFGVWTRYSETTLLALLFLSNKKGIKFQVPRVW